MSTGTTMKDKKTLAELIGGRLSEGHEILDLMLRAAEDPDAILTEREKMRLYILRFMCAAITESANHVTQKFAVNDIDVALDMWICAGEAIATFNVQAFDLSTPRNERVLRKHMKEAFMHGHDHFLDLMKKHNPDSMGKNDVQ